MNQEVSKAEEKEFWEKIYPNMTAKEKSDFAKYVFEQCIVDIFQDIMDSIAEVYKNEKSRD